MKAAHLTAACLKDPLGIDIASPHLCWQDEDGIRQSAYEVRCLGKR